MRPSHVDVINNILSIAWDDGHESYFDGEPLRRACPCAVCKGETNIMVEYKPAPPQYGPASFQLMTWQYVGGYALAIQWGDGHSSGIYSFDYLRRLCGCDACAGQQHAEKDKQS
jgi:DUF971 family protein